MTWNIERIRGTYFNVDLHGDVGDHDKSDDTDDDDDGDGDNDDNKKTLGGTSIKDLSQKGESDMSHISIVYFRLLHWSQNFLHHSNYTITPTLVLNWCNDQRDIVEHSKEIRGNSSVN